MEKSPWVIQSQKAIYTNPWISVTEYAVLNPSGNPGIYGKVHFKNTAVGIVAMDDHRNIFLVGQYRFATDSYSWEIPEGGEPVSSDPLDGAKRELAEETGLYADNWQVLLTMHLSNSVSDEKAIVYLATGLMQHLSSPEDTEQLVVKKLPLEEACQLIEAGVITDSMSVAALIKIKLLFAEGKLK